MLIDDFSDPELVSNLGTRWRGASDKVMGGISEAGLAREVRDGRGCLRLTGAVRLENNGGFIQAALDLAPSGGVFDAAGFSGVELDVRGNGEAYSLHLRTPDNRRPWQSYRAGFVAEPTWRRLRLPFDGFTPHRLEAPLRPTALRRIALVAIGRAFQADLTLRELGFYS